MNKINNCHFVSYPCKNQRLIFLDLETTGLRTKDYKPGIIQLAALDGESNEYFSELINTGFGIQYGAQKVHGINQLQIISKPYLPEVWKKFLDWIKNLCQDSSPIFVTYNGKLFDIPVLKDDLEQFQIQLDPNWKYIDFYLHVKKSIQPFYFEDLQLSKSLGSLYQHALKQQIQNYHCALGDCISLRSIYYIATQDQYQIFDQQNNQKYLNPYLLNLDEIFLPIKVIRKQILLALKLQNKTDDKKKQKKTIKQQKKKNNMAIISSDYDKQQDLLQKMDLAEVIVAKKPNQEKMILVEVIVAKKPNQEKINQLTIQQIQNNEQLIQEQKLLLQQEIKLENLQSSQIQLSQNLKKFTSRRIISNNQSQIKFD